VDKKTGVRFPMMWVFLFLLFTGPALYLGCGDNSQPPAVVSGKKPVPGATKPLPPPQEPDDEDSTRGGPGKSDLASNYTDRLLKKLREANIAFNTPTSINLDDTALIQLILSVSKPIAELKQQIEALGEKHGERIKISEVMEARLTGTNFKIEAVTKESQAISALEDTKWEWEVKPAKVGRQTLHLTLTAKLNFKGSTVERTIRTFDKKIEVNVTLTQKITTHMEKFGKWYYPSGIIAIVLAFFRPILKWVRRRRKKAKPVDEDWH
jgi:hypothetical protein